MIFFKFAIVKRTERMEIFDAGVLIQLDVQENSTGLLCISQNVYSKVQTQNANSKLAKSKFKTAFN